MPLSNPIFHHNLMDLKSLIRDIPDFPKPGILFRDITTLLRDPAGLRYTIDCLAERFTAAGAKCRVLSRDGVAGVYYWRGFGL